MDRVQVMEKMSPIMDISTRRINHGPRTRVAVSPEMVSFRPGGGGRLMEMTPEGVRGMAKFAGIPVSFGQQLNPDTFGRVATELLSRKGSYSVLTKEGAIIDFAKPTEYHNLNPERVLRTVERTIPSVDFHRVLLMPDHSVNIELVGERSRPVVAGDMVQAGAMMAFSPIGTIEPIVQSFVVRLACTNGVTSNDVLRQFSFGGGGGEGDDVWQWFRQSVREAYRSVDGIVRQWRRMVRENIKPADRAMILEGMLKDAHIGGDVAEAVRAMALENPPETSYDMFNLLTYASSHLIEEPRAIRQAQEAAINYVSSAEHARVCPVCHKQR